MITTPHIPGLELHLPRHTVITHHDGQVVHEVSITADSGWPPDVPAAGRLRGAKP